MINMNINQLTEAVCELEDRSTAVSYAQAKEVILRLREVCIANEDALKSFAKSVERSKQRNGVTTQTKRKFGGDCW